MSSASYANWAHAYPYFPLAEHALGLAHCALADTAEAATWLRRAAELAPLRDEIREDLARCERDRGHNQAEGAGQRGS